MLPAVMTQANFQQKDPKPTIDSQQAIADGTEAYTTRQEDLELADLNALVKRYQHNPQALLSHMHGGLKIPVHAIDFDMDLQTAISAVQQTKDAYDRMPADLRKDYRSWESFLTAIAGGELVIHNGRATDPADLPPEPKPEVTPPLPTT